MVVRKVYHILNSNWAWYHNPDTSPCSSGEVKLATHEHMEKGPAVARNVDNGLQIHQEENKSRSKRQS